MTNLAPDTGIELAEALVEPRAELNEAEVAMVAAAIARFQAARKIGQVKQQYGAQVRDASREEEVVARIAEAFVAGGLPAEIGEKYGWATVAIGRDIQEFDLANRADPVTLSVVAELDSPSHRV